MIYFVLLAFKDNLLAQNHLYNWFTSVFAVIYNCSMSGLLSNNDVSSANDNISAFAVLGMSFT